MIKKITTIIATCFLAACAAPTSHITANTTKAGASQGSVVTSTNVLNKIKTNKKIVLGTSADFPPFEWHMLKDGKDTIVGFDISIAKEIAKDLDVELVIEDMNFDSLIASVQTGKVDMVMAGMNPTPEREKEVDFSNIYYQTSIGVLVKKEDVSKLTALDQLSKLTIGAQKGSLSESLVQEKLPEAKLTAMPKNDALVLALKTGRLDAVAVDTVVAENFAKVNQEVVVSPHLHFNQEDNGLVVAVAKNNTDLVEAINKTLSRLIAEGKINEFILENSQLMNE